MVSSVGDGFLLQRQPSVHDLWTIMPISMGSKMIVEKHFDENLLGKITQ